MRQLLDHAAENGYGIPGFNVNNMEQIQAIMEAAAATDSPVILQGSAGARKYAGEAFLRGLFAAAVETWPSIPVAVHLDHGSSPSLCQSAIDSGFTSVMMDGSLMEDAKTPASFAYNMETTRAVVARAHAVGVSVEGELGVLGSLETGEAGDEDGVGAEGKLTRDQMLTDPDQAAEFVAATGVDALAVAIGTSHGAYKFTTRPTSEVLAIDRIKEIHAKLPNTHLVMHGSSSVPQELLAIIRAYGGQMKETYGVPVEEIQEGIRHGVRKVNIDTDIRLAMAGAMRRAMATDPSTFDPRVFLKEARLAARDLCVERYQQFGAAGQASRIVAVPLSEMAKRYARRAQLKIATARRTTDTARPANGGFEMTQEYLPNVYVEFRGSFPDVAAALDGLGEAADGAGPLDERTVRLVKLGIAIGSSSEGSVRSNARKALAAGATPEEIRHVAILAFTTCGFPTGIAGLGWIDRVLDAETRAPEASSREER